jgi:hypothetical protein
MEDMGHHPMDTGHRQPRVHGLQRPDGGFVRAAGTADAHQKQKSPNYHAGHADGSGAGKIHSQIQSGFGREGLSISEWYNEKLTVNALQESIKDYNHARGVNKTGIHDLRKTYTTMALASAKPRSRRVRTGWGMETHHC